MTSSASSYDRYVDLVNNAHVAVTSFYASIAVNGEVYRGKAVAADIRTLVVRTLSADFFEAFMNGMKMAADFGGARWTASLIGSSQAASAMSECMAAARRGITS